MAKITQAIPDAAFELIRTRIGEILAVEIPEQAILKSRPDIDAQVWVEREAALSVPELPAVNVSYTAGENSQHAPTAAHFMHTFYIDAYTSAKASATEHGSLTSQKAAQSLINVCRGILAHNVYKRLDFAPGFIMSHHVRTIQMSETAGEDGDHVTRARLMFEVSAVETNLLEIARAAEGADAVVKLEGTDKGFKLILNN